MRILVTNDDGINAPGLGILEEIAMKIAIFIAISSKIPKPGAFIPSSLVTKIRITYPIFLWVTKERLRSRLAGLHYKLS